MIQTRVRGIRTSPSSDTGPLVVPPPLLCLRSACCRGTVIARAIGWARRLPEAARTLALAVSVVCAAQLQANQETPLELRTTALSGMEISGNFGGGPIRKFLEAPEINDDANIAFLAEHTSGAASVWLFSPPGLRLLAMGDVSAPDTGANFAAFSDLALADGGLAAFMATLAGANARDYTQDSIWIDDAGQLELAVRGGSPASDPTLALRFTHFETPLTVNGGGQTAFLPARATRSSPETLRAAACGLPGGTPLFLPRTRAARRPKMCPAASFSRSRNAPLDAWRWAAALALVGNQSRLEN